MTRSRTDVDDGRGVVSGAFAVLTAVRSLGLARVSEVQRRCGLPRTTVYRLLSQLEDVGAVERAGGRWRRGLALFELGSGVPAEPRLTPVARRPLMDLANATGAWVALSVGMASDYVVVEVFPGQNRLPLELEPGIVHDDPAMAVVRAQEQARRGDFRAVIDAGGIDPRVSCVAAPVRLSPSDVAAVWLMVPSGDGIPLPVVAATRRTAGRIASQLFNATFSNST
jgi:IclR family transcriptional regulator, acetate operon repressor